VEVVRTTPKGFDPGARGQRQRHLSVEYIQRLRGRGVELQAALLQAGRTRFRPILMTSLAAILGLLPLALGPGAQMQQPLAI
jgi:HAE1 family hydrophobic/amphiphilic exporter-1